jgi:hypothetical protein
VYSSNCSSVLFSLSLSFSLSLCVEPSFLIQRWGLTDSCVHPSHGQVWSGLWKTGRQLPGTQFKRCCFPAFCRRISNRFFGGSFVRLFVLHSRESQFRNCENMWSPVLNICPWSNQNEDIRVRWLWEGTNHWWGKGLNKRIMMICEYYIKKQVYHHDW